jgi:hypothetical protein
MSCMYPSPNIIRNIRSRILVGKPERKRPLGGPRCRCEVDLERNRWGVMG